MPSLFVFLVAYAGIGGQSAGTIDGQIQKMLAADHEVHEVTLDRAARKALVDDGTGAADLIRAAGYAGKLVVARDGTAPPRPPVSSPGALPALLAARAVKRPHATSPDRHRSSSHSGR